MSDLSRDDLQVTRLDDASGHDIDIWGDGSETQSTPIPDWWDDPIVIDDGGYEGT